MSSGGKRETLAKYVGKRNKSLIFKKVKMKLFRQRLEYLVNLKAIDIGLGVGCRSKALVAVPITVEKKNFLE